MDVLTRVGVASVDDSRRRLLDRCFLFAARLPVLLRSLDAHVHVFVSDPSGTERDVIEFLKVELAAVTVGFLVTIWVTREFRGA